MFFFFDDKVRNADMLSVLGDLIKAAGYNE